MLINIVINLNNIMLIAYGYRIGTSLAFCLINFSLL